MEEQNQYTTAKVLLTVIMLGMGGFFIFVPATEAAAGINRQINFQGKVTNTDGTNVTNGSYTFLFCLYTTGSPATACTSGADNDAVWRESKSITVTDGIFQTDLGDTTALPGSVDFNTDNIYLGINFNANGQMTPLVRFTAAPYAMNADKVHGLTVTDTTGTLTVANGKTVSFADAFSTTGAFPLTLTTTASTTATLPTGTITIADLATAQTLTNKTIGSTGLVFSGATTDITTGTGEDLTLTANGAGIISLSDSVSITGTSLTATSATTVTLGSTGADTIILGNGGADTITIGNAASTGVSITDNNWSVSAAGVASFITGTTIGSQTFTTNNIADSGALTIASGTASALTLNSGTTGTINIGTDASAETINIGNTGAAVKTVYIGNQAQANVITIGTTTAGSAIQVLDDNWNISTAGAASFASATVSGTLAANGGITFDAATDTVGAHTLSGTIDANTNILTNIGNAGTDFVASTGALNLAGVLTASSGVSVAAGQSYTGAGAVTLSSGGSSGLMIDSASGVTTIATGDYLALSHSGTTGAAAGYIWYDSADNKFKINENGTTKTLCNMTDAGCGSAGGTTWDAIGDAAVAGAIAMNEYAQTMDWNTAATAAAFDGLTVTLTNDATTDTLTQRAFVVANLNDAAATGTTETIMQVDNRDINETVGTGLLVENTGAGTMTDAIKILETAGTVTTAINIGNNVTTGISIGTGVTTGISVGSGGVSIAAGALAVNSDSITSDGNLVINATTTDIQDAVTVDSLTVDTGGISIAAGQSYTGTGAVTLSSGSATGLTIDSGTTGALAIGTDASAETITIGTGAAAKTVTLGSTNTTSTTTLNSGTGGIVLQPEGTNVEGTVQVGAGGAGSNNPDLFALDTKDNAGDPATAIEGTMYYNQNTNKFRCYEGSAWTDCIGTGGGGTPAGSNTQIQFNNSGAFGADAGLSFDSTTQQLGLNGTDAGILMNGITNEPSAPASGKLELYAKSVAGRMMPKWVGPSGLDSIVQPMVAMNKVAWWNPPGNATTAPGVLGMAAQTIVSNGGTALTARNVATTNLFTRMKRAGIVSTATAGYIASMRNGTAQFTVGNGSGLGGFTYVARFGSTDAITAARAFAGFTSSTAVPTNVEPSTLTNAIGMCQLSTSNNWQICYGGSAAQTPIDLGASFPANTASTDMYELILYAPVNVNNAVNYRVTRLNTGNVASGTLTAATPGTQLPASTTLLATRFWKTNNTAASVVGLDIASMYIETDY